MRSLARCGLVLGLLALAAGVLSGTGRAAEPMESGLKPGQRPGPYTAIVSVGPQRGTLHCFICETEDKPAVAIFARTPTDGLGKLIRGLDQACVRKHRPHHQPQAVAHQMVVVGNEDGHVMRPDALGRRFGGHACQSTPRHAARQLPGR